MKHRIHNRNNNDWAGRTHNERARSTGQNQDRSNIQYRACVRYGRYSNGCASKAHLKCSSYGKMGHVTLAMKNAHYHEIVIAIGERLIQLYDVIESLKTR